jgi:hypothetical protein
MVPEFFPLQIMHFNEDVSKPKFFVEKSSNIKRWFPHATKQSTPRATSTSTSSPLRRQSPIILALELIMQRLNPFGLLPLTQAVSWRNLEECRRRLDQPLGFNSTAAMHVLLGRFHKAVVHDMFSGFAKQTRARMQVDRRAFDECLVALGRIFARRVAEEA